MTEPVPLKKIMTRAGSLLARRAYSCGEIRKKLLSSGDEVQVDLVIQRLRDLNLLNDEDYAYNFALVRMSQNGWGGIKVLHALLRRQIAPAIAEAAIERVQSGQDRENLLGHYLEQYLSRRGLPQDRKSIQKLISHLRRRGFPDDAIFRALRERVPAVAWGRIEIGDDLA